MTTSPITSQLHWMLWMLVVRTSQLRTAEGADEMPEDKSSVA